MACNATANGATLDCVCDGCGLTYNYDTKTYTALCCGAVVSWTSKLEVDDPDEPPRPGHVAVDISGLTLLQAMQLLDKSDPGKLNVDAPFAELNRAVKLEGNAPVEELARQLKSGRYQAKA